MTTGNQNDKPRMEFTEITQLGLKALQLVQQYSAQVTPRLAPTLVSNLETNLTAMGAVVPAAIGAKQTSKASTIAQNDVVSVGYGMVTAARLAVSKSKPRPSLAVRRAYGVGMKTNGGLVKHVVAALQQIAARIIAEPAEAKTFGMLPADADAFDAQVQAIQDADLAQENARANAPLTTQQRNAVANQVLAAVGSIAAAGLMAFPNDPTARGSFEALVKG